MYGQKTGPGTTKWKAARKKRRIKFVTEAEVKALVGESLQIRASEAILKTAITNLLLALVFFCFLWADSMPTDEEVREHENELKEQAFSELKQVPLRHV